MPLRYVRNAEIDFAQWDKALALCYNENPYAYSSWLTLVSPGWDALISKNYDVLIPLPIKKKLGISYLSQPQFTQQLGVFALTPQGGEAIKKVLNQIEKKYSKIHLQLNTENYDETLQLKKRITYILPLYETYENLYSHFNTHHKRHLSKALEISRTVNLKIEESKDTTSFIENFKRTVGLKDKSLHKKDYDLMEKIISTAAGKILFCTSAEGEILSGLFYLTSKTRIINLFNFVTPLGKNKKAMFLLLNFWIKLYANHPLLLDFEGSEIDSIARFYSGFGASPKNYQIFTKKGFWQL